MGNGYFQLPSGGAIFVGTFIGFKNFPPSPFISCASSQGWLRIITPPPFGRDSRYGSPITGNFDSGPIYRVLHVVIPQATSYRATVDLATSTGTEYGVWNWMQVYRLPCCCSWQAAPSLTYSTNPTSWPASIKKAHRRSMPAHCRMAGDRIHTG